MKIDRHLSWVLLRRGDEILMGLKKRGFGAGKLNGVGGKQEAGETIEECAVRETQEEIGVKITKYECLGKIIFDNLFYKNVPECNMMHCFVATEWEGEPVESDEEKPQWIKISDLDYSKLWGDDEYWLPPVLEEKEIEAYFHYNSDNTFDDYWVDEVPNKQIGPLIDDELVGLGKKDVDEAKLKRFYGARAILLNDKNQIGLIHATNRGWYKLPGGRREDDEMWGENLRREVIEETGYKIKNLASLGYTVNIRADWDMYAIATMYLCKTGEFVGKHQMDDEVEDGDTLEWFDSFDDAIAALEAVDLKKIDFYGAYFFTRREIEALKYAKQVYKELYG